MWGHLVAVSAAVVLLSSVQPSVADGPEPFPDFQAKRVKPPAPGTTKRITVQITPPAQEEARVVAAPQTTMSQVGRFDWFWQDISPDQAQSAPGRLETALLALRQAELTVPAPRLQNLQNIAQQHTPAILRSTVGTHVSPALVLAVIAVESAGEVRAESAAGAQGLMQLMPATASRFGVDDRFQPDQNIAGGVRYLDWLMTEFDRDPILVLAGYNAGEGAVRTHAGVPPFAETRDYVPKVLAAFDVAKGLCRTPPELISDGCVFVTSN